MATLNRQVGTGSDDCWRVLTSPNWGLSNNGQEVGAFSSSNYQWGGGMRFTNITIPQGSTINEAYLTLHCNFVDTGTVVNSRISAEKVNDAPTFADDGDIFDTRWANRTTARVNWDDIPEWEAEVDYDSPDIKTVIKEIIDRGGWASGQDIVIFWEDFEDRSTHAFNCRRRGYAYAGSVEFATKLVIDYTPITRLWKVIWE